MSKMISRANKHCAYFPCHKRLEDCTFCYCPFYPCGDEHKGSYLITKDRRKVWSCQDCSWIHSKKTVDGILNEVRNNNLSKCIASDKLNARDAGVIILGHGSNIKGANDSLRKLAKEIKNESGLNMVEPAFLQLCQPDLQKAIKRAVKVGCKRIIIVPFFLFLGNHVTRDIPKVIEEEAKIYKDVELIYAKNLGQNKKINNIVMDCIREASI